MAEKLFYFAAKMRRIHLSFFAKIAEIILRYRCGCEISGKTIVGKNLELAHNGLGVVINPKTVIGDNVKIHQNVTIGGREGSGCPIIGNNVLIGAGAVVLGDIKIGDNSKIGANAVVLQDVPEGTIAVGVPAVIKYK